MMNQSLSPQERAFELCNLRITLEIVQRRALSDRELSQLLSREDYLDYWQQYDAKGIADPTAEDYLGAEGRAYWNALKALAERGKKLRREKSNKVVDFDTSLEAKRAIARINGLEVAGHELQKQFEEMQTDQVYFGDHHAEHEFKPLFHEQLEFDLPVLRSVEEINQLMPSPTMLFQQTFFQRLLPSEPKDVPATSAPDRVREMAVTLLKANGRD